MVTFLNLMQNVLRSHLIVLGLWHLFIYLFCLLMFYVFIEALR